MKKVSKIVAVVLALVMVLSVFAGCQPKTPDQITIAVAVGSYGSEQLKAQAYLEGYMAEKLNIKFIFSEELGSVDKILTFIENAYSSGAQGVIDIASSSYQTVEPLAAKCEELGMYFGSYCANSESFMDKYPHSMGSSAVNFEPMTEAFDKMLTEDLLSDGKVHSMVVCPGAARQGNAQQYNGAFGSFKAFVKKYNLSITDQQIDKYIMESAATTEVPTGRDDVKITIMPLFTGDALFEVIKNGEYDTVVVCGDYYLRLENAIKETEKALNKNIHFYTVTSVSDTTKNSFNTKDIFGNTALDGALLKSSANTVVLLSMIMNGIYGNRDLLLDNGKPTGYHVNLWPAYSVEEYEKISNIDASAETYMFNDAEFKNMVAYYNDKVNCQWLKEYIEKNTQVDAVLERIAAR